MPDVPPAAQSFSAQSSCPPPLVVVAGPTASGKSACALDLAETFNGTIINGDSMQVYDGLRLLTARPSAADEARVPHVLYGVLDPSEACSVARWLTLAVAAIERTWQERRLPVVAGGSGLYLKALLEGLSPLPTVPLAIRRQGDARWDAIGSAAFHAEVATRDPDSAAVLPVADRQRLVRAWAVYEATGRPLSAWRQQAPPQPAITARSAVIALIPPRDQLYDRCNRRFEHMVAHGALDEVAALAARRLDPTLPALKALGVAELSAHLAGSLPLDEAISRAQGATRRYAKRQHTWLRHQLPADLTVNEKYSESIRPKIFSFIQRFLLTGRP